MASAASVSESMQVSIALQRHENLLRGHQRPPQQYEKAVGRCKQVLLVMAVCGMEMCMTFEQIYQVLILQYLGVPLSLVSLNGVICGLASMTIIPIIGFVTDRGSNPKKRKMVSLYVGMIMFQLGLLLLLIAGFVKISLLHEILHDLETTSTVLSNKDEQFENKSLLFNATNKDKSGSDINQINVTGNKNKYSTSENNLPLTAYLTICGFAFVDIGFDTSMSVSRAYILESVPKFQHIKLLVMTTIVQASSGTIFALLGVLDISDALGNAFKVDGTSAILIFFCIFLFFIVTSGFTSTTLTGYCLTRHPELTNKEFEPYKHNVTTKNRSDDKTSRNQQNSYKSEILYSDALEVSQKPLLQNDFSSNSYASVNISSSFTYSNTNFDNDELSNRTDHAHKLHRSISKDSKGNGTGIPQKPSYSKTVPETDESDLENTSQIFETVKTKQDLKSSICLFRAPESIISNHTQQMNGTAGKTRMKKKLTILAISTFFTIGASTAFLYYAANALTLGIFHGDPTALPGTDGKDLYDKGLRTAALGNLTFYILFTVTSLLNNKLIDLVGERLLFIIFHLAFVTPLFALVTTQCIEAYFATILTMGVFRHAVYTLPFVMANKISQDTGDNTNRESSKTNLGKIMSLIGFLIPAHYLILSSMMGPILEATGNVWIPLMYCLGCACASVLIFCLIFFVK